MDSKTNSQRLLFILLFAGMSLPLAAQNFTGLDTAIQRITNQTEFLGATILVAKGDQIIHHQGYGLAHPGFDIPATTETKYFVQCADANLLSAIVMKMVEEKRIDLNEKITHYLPHLPDTYQKITVKHLLTCTSGVMDYHYLGDPFLSKLHQPLSRDEAMARFINMPLTIEPGSGFDWSISNFTVLSAILEKVSGRTYQELSKEFLAPLKLQNTGSIEYGKVIPQFTNGYTYDGESETYQQVMYSLLAYDPVINLYSTSEDVFRFCRAIASGTLISKESYALMTSREEAKRNNSDEMGYLMMLGKMGQHEFIGNFGSLGGYSGAWIYLTDLDVTVVVLSNSAGSNGQHASLLSDKICNYLLGLPANPLPAKKDSPTLEDLEVTATEASKITGTYHVKRTIKDNRWAKSYEYYERTIRVFNENGKMMIQYLGELPEPLLRQKDGGYKLNSNKSLIINFTVSSENQSLINISYSGFPVVDEGMRIGDADVKTFHNGIKK